MKLIKATLLITLAVFSSCLHQNNILPMTPKALDLENHFGTEPVQDIFGPKALIGQQLARRGVEVGTAVTPIRNFEREINPSNVVSGDLDNTAYDASRIVKATIANPKADIHTVLVHDAVVKTPVQLGTIRSENTVTSMSRVDGKVHSKTVISEKPVLGVVNQVKTVETPHNTVVDLKTGKLITPDTAKVYHGRTNLK